MRVRVLSAAIVFMLVWGAVPASADLKLEFQNGFVTLDAKNVTVRQILAEWARLGGTKVLNGDRVVGSPVTLQLVHVSERHALDVILRSVSGYMAAPRLAARGGASMYDRILVMPTSTAPAASASAPRPAPVGPPPMYPGGYPGGAPVGYPGASGGFGQAMPQRPPGSPGGPVQPQVMPMDAEDQMPEEDEPPDEGEMVPAPVPPVVTGGVAQPFVPGGGPGSVPPGYPTAPTAPPQTGPSPTPGVPPGAAPTPGVIIQPAQPTPTARPTRP